MGHQPTYMHVEQLMHVQWGGIEGSKGGALYERIIYF